MSNSTVSTGPTLPADFDPFEQSFTIMTDEGETIELTMHDLNSYTQYAVTICINWASQIGASVILLVLLMILTKHDKRRSPIFVFNALALALNIIRTILQCVYFTGAWYFPYAVFAMDYSRVPRREYVTQVALESCTLCLCICIEVSLIFQVRVVCITLERIHRTALMLLSALVAMNALGWRLYLTIINAEQIMAAQNMLEYQWIAKTANFTTTASICVFSLIFCAKLGFAIRNRRKLGLKQFGPMQIIFIMGCQTLVIPAIFSVLQYLTTIPELGSQVLTLVAIFLPLSAIWASVATDGREQASRGHDAHHRLFGDFRLNRRRSTNRNSSSASNKPLNIPLSPISGGTSRTLSTDEKMAVDLV